MPTPRRLRRALSQRLNLAGVASFLTVLTRAPHLALPHCSVPDIRALDWDRLARLGVRGVVFDKDNTLTAPYAPAAYPPIQDSLRRCCDVFPGRVAVFSNSAGLGQYDPDGAAATAVEEAVPGVHVIRHEAKKPAGTAEEIEKYFGCSSSQLVMVGDRHFTDIVYGNRNGFLTILTKPLCLSGEPFIVRQIRKVECYLADRWYRKGLKPAKHNMLSEIGQCIKVPTIRLARHFQGCICADFCLCILDILCLLVMKTVCIIVSSTTELNSETSRCFTAKTTNNILVNSRIRQGQTKGCECIKLNNL